MAYVEIKTKQGWSCTLDVDRIIGAASVRVGPTDNLCIFVISGQKIEFEASSQFVAQVEKEIKQLILNRKSRIIQSKPIVMVEE